MIHRIFAAAAVAAALAGLAAPAQATTFTATAPCAQPAVRLQAAALAPAVGGLAANALASERAIEAAALTVAFNGYAILASLPACATA